MDQLIGEALAPYVPTGPRVLHWLRTTPLASGTLVTVPYSEWDLLGKDLLSWYHDGPITCTRHMLADGCQEFHVRFGRYVECSLVFAAPITGPHLVLSPLATPPLTPGWFLIVPVA